MGRTPKPLKILVANYAMTLWPEIAALRNKGHLVQIPPVDEFESFDLILGPNCWRMEAELLPYLDLAIKGARGVKYPAKGKK